MAWDLFRENRQEFAANDKLTRVFCDSAVECGILTRIGDRFKFRHERIHRFFVACYLYRQPRRPLRDWDAEVKGGFGTQYWSDTLELWGELYAEKVSTDQTESRTYYDFLDEVIKFSPKIFSEKLYPQLQRMYQAGTLPKDTGFIERVANELVETTALSVN